MGLKQKLAQTAVLAFIALFIITITYHRDWLLNTLLTLPHHYSVPLTVLAYTPLLLGFMPRSVLACTMGALFDLPLAFLIDMLGLGIGGCHFCNAYSFQLFDSVFLYYNVMYD